MRRILRMMIIDRMFTLIRSLRKEKIIIMMAMKLMEIIELSSKLQK